MYRLVWNKSRYMYHGKVQIQIHMLRYINVYGKEEIKKNTHGKVQIQIPVVMYIDVYGKVQMKNTHGEVQVQIPNVRYTFKYQWKSTN